MSHIRHYRVLPWATRPLTLLESIAKIPDRQVVKTGKSSIFWLLLSSFFFLLSSFFFLLSSFLQHDSTITAEAITTIQTRKNSINHWVLYSPFVVLKERTQLVGDFSGNLTLMLATIRHFIWNNIHSNYVNRSSTEHVQLARLAAAVYFYFRREDSSWRLSLKRLKISTFVQKLTCAGLYKECSIRNVLYI